MFRFLLPLAVILAGAPSRLFAEPASGQAEVVAVRFALATPAVGSSGPWLEAGVQVEARPGADDPGRMLRGVRVTLELGCEVPAAAGRRIEFYQADAEAVALGAGRSVVRFYLPPEIVRRDGARAEPRFWRVELAIAGQALPETRGRASASLAADATQREFAARIAAEASRNDGVLQPQYLTPFAWEYPTETPTFVRREPTR